MVASACLEMQRTLRLGFMIARYSATLQRMIKNVVFDAGGVLLHWDPPAVIARLHPDPDLQARIRRQIFEHQDWLEFDRGTYDEAAAAERFSQLSGLSAEETRTLIRETRASLTPIDGTIQLLEELAGAGVHLYLLSNMPVSTFEYLSGKFRFFRHFRALVISGAILLVKPEPAIYKHLVDRTGIVPAESVFIDDVLKNVIAARECGLHAIQFRGPVSCRHELRAYLPAAGL
jgi:putative hydrolase of the HAD superfamily